MPPYDEKMVECEVELPAWLDAAAQAQGLDLSKVLTEKLTEILSDAKPLSHS